MSRAKWKNSAIANIDVKKVPRSNQILPIYVNKLFLVHNGKNYNEILINENMIGHKFGEFSFTRSKFSFKKKLKK